MSWASLFFAFLALAAQEAPDTCEPASKTLKALEGLPPVRDHSIPYEVRMAPLRALAEKNPDDLFIQRYYQNAFRRSFHIADEYDRALTLYRGRPDDALSRYLEARLLMNVEPERSKRTFQELMASKPGFVWPHLDLIGLANLPGRRDSSEIESHLKAFLRVCPETPEAYEHFDLVQDVELLRQGAHNLRRILERRNTPLDLMLWPKLWALETRRGITAEDLQSRLRRDLRRIDSWGFRPVPELFSVYRQGSDLLMDPEVVKGLEARLAREAPESQLMFWLVRDRWYKENPPPRRDASAEEQKVFQEKEAQAKAEWRLRRPADCELIQDQWIHISSDMRWQDRPLVQDAPGIAARMLRCREEFPDVGVSWPPLETAVAELFVRHRVQLDQVPKLLDAGLRAVEKQEKYRISQELIPAELRQKTVDNRELTFQRTHQIRIDYFLALGRTAEAQTLVEQEIEKLESKKPGEDAPARDQALFRFQRNQWLQRLGAVAEKENRVDDALALYQSSLEGTSKQYLTNPSAALADIKRFYLAHEGTEEKWLDWATAGKAETALPKPTPVQFVQPLPEFSSPDLAGRTWELKDLKGKGTLINFWATWCGPCRAEHPEIQKLHDRLQGNGRLQVLTVSVDENPALVTAYLKEKGFTFPVIHAPLLADRLFPYVGLPTNFLVNAEGRRTSLYMFGGGDESLRRVLSDLEVGSRTSAPR
jgi:thiol-disulfide isomerase/thioredoxin